MLWELCQCFTISLDGRELGGEKSIRDKLRLIVTVAVGLLVIGYTASYFGLEIVQAAPVTVNGKNFVINGQPIMFRGVNIQFTGLHHPESGCQPLSAGTFDELKLWNVNIIRPWLNMELASPSYGSWSQAFFDNVALMLDLAEARGIYVMPSMCHQYNVGPAFSGTGLPSWMFSGVSTQNEAWARLYGAVVQNDTSVISTQIRTAMKEYFQRLVAIFRNRAIVMGYDIFNEPEYRTVPGYGFIAASHFYEGLSQYITEVDAMKPQAIESNFVDLTYRPNIPNLFVTGHGYADHTRTYNLANMKNYFTSSDYWVLGGRWNVPTFNSEWFLAVESFGLTADQIVAWFHTYVQAMDELGIGWQYLRTGTSPSNLHWSPGVKAELLSWFALNAAPQQPPTGTGTVQIRSQYYNGTAWAPVSVTVSVTRNGTYFTDYRTNTLGIYGPVTLGVGIYTFDANYQSLSDSDSIVLNAGDVRTVELTFSETVNPPPPPPPPEQPNLFNPIIVISSGLGLMVIVNWKFVKRRVGL